MRQHDYDEDPDWRGFCRCSLPFKHSAHKPGAPAFEDMHEVAVVKQAARTVAARGRRFTEHDIRELLLVSVSDGIVEQVLKALLKAGEIRLTGLYSTDPDSGRKVPYFITTRSTTTT